MNIFLIGPTRSGKSTLSNRIASAFNMTVIDTGLIVRLTADQEDANGLNAGQLSDRGGKGTKWVNDIVDAAFKNQPDRLLIVGYPRSLEQFEHYKSLKQPGKDTKLVVHMATNNTILSRKRGRPDDNAVDVKLEQFYSLLGMIYQDVDLYITSDMKDHDITRLMQNTWDINHD